MNTNATLQPTNSRNAKLSSEWLNYEFRVAELWSVLRLIEGIKQEADHGRK